jgi:CheY-like chemotaxis protein
LASVRILCVDDDGDERALLAAGLRQLGARVTEACSAANARLVLKFICPDVIISDLCMPGESGFELVARLRREQRRPVHTVALTGYDGEATRDRAHAAGFEVVVAKPCDLGRLARLIRSLLEPRPQPSQPPVLGLT